MAQKTTVTTARWIMAVSLSSILASCSTPQAPYEIAMVTEPSLGDRYNADNVENPPHSNTIPQAYVEQFEANAPEDYTVVRGDTLWDISDRFLKEPWRWTEIWDNNPQVYNPHLIYPGDKLTLNYVDGKPTLSLTRDGMVVAQSGDVKDGDMKTTGVQSAGMQLGARTVGAAGNARIKLQPSIRSQSLDDAIPTIAGDAISHFLVYPRVLDDNTINAAPYVIANSEDRLISSVGSKIYVRGNINRDQTRYGVFRKNKALIDPANGAHLGFEMVHVSDAKLLSVGDPSTLSLTRNKMETITGDVLLPINTGMATHLYTPRMPELRGEARIVSLVDAISQTGRNQVVVLNIGANSNIQKGDVLAVETRGKNATDITGRYGKELVQLPNQRTGVLMVFETFDKVSYALVMESTRPLKVNDIITGI